MLHSLWGLKESDTTFTWELTGRCKKRRGSTRAFQSGTHFIIRLVSVLTSFKSVTGYLQLHLGEGLCWMKTDSGSLKRLSSWIHLFWKTKYGPERFLLNCCSVYTDWFFVAPWAAACQAPQDPSVSPRVCLNSHPLSQWCHLSILPSAAPFSFNLSQNQSFSMSRLFAPGGQRIGAAASAAVLPMNVQGCFPLALTGLISLQSKGLSRVFSSTTIWKHQFFSTQPSLWTNFDIHTWLLEKP